MSKFGNIINQAKNGQTGGEPESQKTRKKESRNTGIAVKQNTSKQESQNTGKPESQNTGKPESTTEEKSVNLSIKVPETLRRHWSAEAKREGTSITSIVTEALNDRFGKP